MPSANIETLPRAPPENKSRNPRISLLPAILRTSVLIPYSGIWIPNRNRTSIRKVNINFSFKPEAFHIDIKSAVVGILMPLFTPCVIILIQPFRLLLQLFLLQKELHNQP